MVNYLNARECKYLKERDKARVRADELGQKLTELEVS
ncbi:hypothetical protein A2U01_0080144, partial [Trifolium medium]|nr:hypothetical protein [Trifolium medium]